MQFQEFVDLLTMPPQMLTVLKIVKINEDTQMHIQDYLYYMFL